MQYRLFYTIFVLIILQSVSFAKGEFREKNATINPPKSFFDSYGEVILIKDSVERGRSMKRRRYVQTSKICLKSV